MFEGLGLGARLAMLPLAPKYNWVAYAGATAYSVVTPLGVAIGLGIRTTYDHLPLCFTDLTHLANLYYAITVTILTLKCPISLQVSLIHCPPVF